MPEFPISRLYQKFEVTIRNYVIWFRQVSPTETDSGDGFMLVDWVPLSSSWNPMCSPPNRSHNLVPGILSLPYSYVETLSKINLKTRETKTMVTRCSSSNSEMVGRLKNWAQESFFFQPDIKKDDWMWRATVCKSADGAVVRRKPHWHWL